MSFFFLLISCDGYTYDQICSELAVITFVNNCLLEFLQEHIQAMVKEYNTY